MNVTDDKSTLVQVMVGAVRQQAITWANVDPVPCHHMASLGQNELIWGHIHSFHTVSRQWEKKIPKSAQVFKIMPSKIKFDTFKRKVNQQFMKIPNSRIMERLELNSLSPGKCGCDSKCVNSKHNLGTDILSIQVARMPEDLVDGIGQHLFR